MFRNLIVTYLMIAFTLKGQTYLNVTNDYINNPSFEDYYTCPEGNSVYPSIMWIDTCKYWYSPTQGTSDYFNSCSNTYTSDVPDNYQGAYQQTFDGNGYCGFYAYTNYPLGYIEYIQTKLKIKLLPNIEYKFTMRINKSNVYSYGFKNLGAHFSEFDIKDYSQVYKQYNITPTVLNNGGILDDTTNWQLITGDFIATGIEEYLTIGWFGGPLGEYGLDSGFVYDLYYFVDSLNLYEKKIDTSCYPIFTNENKINILTPNNDNINDAIDLASYKLKSIIFRVYNRWGVELYKTTDINTVWRATTTENKSLDNGVYYYLLSGINNCNKEIEIQSYLQIIN